MAVQSSLVVVPPLNFDAFPNGIPPPPLVLSGDIIVTGTPAPPAWTPSPMTVVSPTHWTDATFQTGSNVVWSGDIQIPQNIFVTGGGTIDMSGIVVNGIPAGNPFNNTVLQGTTTINGTWTAQSATLEDAQLWNMASLAIAAPGVTFTNPGAGATISMVGFSPLQNVVLQNVSWLSTSSLNFMSTSTVDFQGGQQWLMNNIQVQSDVVFQPSNPTSSVVFAGPTVLTGVVRTFTGPISTANWPGMIVTLKFTKRGSRVWMTIPPIVSTTGPHSGVMDFNGALVVPTVYLPPYVVPFERILPAIPTGSVVRITVSSPGTVTIDVVSPVTTLHATVVEWTV